MRKITKAAVNALMNGEKFRLGNTEVKVLPNVTVLCLYGHEIAYRYNNPQKTLSITNAGWETNTTKERLNGLPNVNIYQEKGHWYLNGKLWDGRLVDVL